MDSFDIRIWKTLFVTCDLMMYLNKEIFLYTSLYEVAVKTSNRVWLNLLSALIDTCPEAS